MDFELNLKDEPVTRISLTNAFCCDSQTPLRDVLEEMKSRETGAAMICDEQGVLQGIFTERDALQLMAAGESFDQPIADVMTSNPATIAANASVADAIAQMSRGGYRRLPVLDEDGKPLGLVKTSLLVHYLVEHFPEVVYNLPPNPHHVTQEREGA